MSRTEVDWIELGFELLRTRGPQGVTIEELCRAAGRSKGAFYHRFSGTDAYRDALLARWIERNTASILEHLGAAESGDERQAQLTALDRLALSIDLDLERSIRGWGTHDAVVQDVINQTDRARLEAASVLTHPRESPEATYAATVARYAMFLGFIMMRDPKIFAVLSEWGPRARVDFDAQPHVPPAS